MMQDDTSPAPRDEFLSGLLGLELTSVATGMVEGNLKVRRALMAPNGYLHAASVIGLADSACGFGCMRARPQGAVSFTAIELKSNFLGSAREGETIACKATLVHGGRTTQVWDAQVTNADTGKPVALFRCTQLLIYPREAPAS